jgi:hypothetical protein
MATEDPGRTASHGGGRSGGGGGSSRSSGSNSGVAPHLASPLVAPSASPFCHPLSQVDSPNADLLRLRRRETRAAMGGGNGQRATTGLRGFVVPDLLMTGQRRAAAPSLPLSRQPITTVTWPRYRVGRPRAAAGAVRQIGQWSVHCARREPLPTDRL